MLKFFNRLERTRNFVLLLFAVVMVASLVFWGASTGGGPTGDLSRSGEAVAKVKSETVTVGELVRQKETYEQMSGGRQSFPTSMMLNQMISGKIISLEADRLGLTASDTEVAAEVREMFKNSDGKPFDQRRYEQNVIAQYGSVAAFEENVRDDISGKKLEAFLTSGVTVSEEEVLRDYQRKNTKFDLTYVSVNHADLAQKMTPTEEDLKEYFEKNKASYYISVPQKKIRYIFLSTAKIGEKLPISEEDLRAEYQNIPADKKKLGVLGQEIVLRIAKPEFEGQVLEKANELVGQLKKDGEIVSEAAFGEIAKGHSENPASASTGGKLKGPVRENTSKPDDPYQRLLRMQPGQITEPIKYEGRYFILRRGEDVPKSFGDARKEIEVSLRNRRAYGVAAELAQKVLDALKQSKDAQRSASEFASQANMSVGEMIRETGYIKPGDDVPNIGVSPDFEEALVKLENPSDVGEKTPIQNGFAIPLLVDKKEPRDAEFAEVRDRVVEIVKLEKARASVEEIAKQIAAGAASAGALSGAAVAKGLKAQEQKSFVLGSPLGQGPSASTSEALEDAIYALKIGEITKTPIKSGDNWYIVGVTKREEANMDEFAAQRDDLIRQALTTKRSNVFQDYLASTRQQMEAAGDIKIYKEALEKVDGPGLPFGSAN